MTLQSNNNACHEYRQVHKALTKGFFPLIMYSIIELQTPAGPVTGGVPAGAPFTLSFFE